MFLLGKASFFPLLACTNCTLRSKLVIYTTQLLPKNAGGGPLGAVDQSFKEESLMPNVKTVVPYQGTPEQEEKLRQVIAEHKDQPGATMPVLQAAQEIFGYLPEEVQIMIAEGLDIPLSEVYGVASFYAQFTLNPKGKYQISVCLGTACYVKGAGDILAAVEQKLGIKPGGITPDGKFSLDACRCIGACGLAPVMMINEDVYGRLTPGQVAGILDSYT